jgi:hypothetical protein
MPASHVTTGNGICPQIYSLNDGFGPEADIRPGIAAVRQETARFDHLISAKR